MKFKVYRMFLQKMGINEVRMWESRCAAGWRIAEALLAFGAAFGLLRRLNPNFSEWSLRTVAQNALKASKASAMPKTSSSRAKVPHCATERHRTRRRRLWPGRGWGPKIPMTRPNYAHIPAASPFSLQH